MVLTTGGSQGPEQSAVQASVLAQCLKTSQHGESRAMQPYGAGESGAEFGQINVTASCEAVCGEYRHTE